MTLTQRLTRAGLTFILLGTVASLVPTDGNAEGDTYQCNRHDTYTIGTVYGDTATAYIVPLHGTLILNAYENNGPDARAQYSPSNMAIFTTSASNRSSVTLTGEKAGTATLNFRDGSSDGILRHEAITVQ